jgi:hypothetical protein
VNDAHTRSVIDLTHPVLLMKAFDAVQQASTISS